MEPMRAVQCRLCRHIRAQSLTRIFQSDLSNTSNRLRHQPGRLKATLARTSNRAFGTTPSRSQSHPPPDAQAADAQRAPQQSSGEKTGQDGWRDWLQRPRPHGTKPADNKLDAAKLEQGAGSTLALADWLETSNRAPNRSTDPYYSALSPTRDSFSSAGSPARFNMSSRIQGEIRNLDTKPTHDAADAFHLRLGPMLGRTLAVDAGANMDLQSAFRVLESRCSFNRVKNDFLAQRTHIRKGLQKKRTRSARWRTLFKQGFVREVARVRRMKRQGW